MPQLPRSVVKARAQALREAGASALARHLDGQVGRRVRGLVERHILDVIVGIVVAVSYWSILRGVLPNDPHISWQEHLFGLLGGIAAAMLIRERRPPRSVEPRARKSTVGPTGDGSRAALHKELDDLGLS